MTAERYGCGICLEHSDKKYDSVWAVEEHVKDEHFGRAKSSREFTAVEALLMLVTHFENQHADRECCASIVRDAIALREDGIVARIATRSKSQPEGRE